MYASHLNQARWSGSSCGATRYFCDVVEAAAVHLPELAADAGLAVATSFGKRQRLVEQDEVERRADPRDRRDHVQPADQQVEPVRHVRVERERRSSSAPPPVLGDGDELAERGLELLVGRPADAASQHLEDLRLRPPVDEDDEAEAVPASYSAFSRASSASTAGSASEPCSAAERADSPLRWPIAGCASRISFFSSSGSSWTSVRARAAGRARSPAARRSACAPRRARRAPRRSAAPVGHASVGRDEERNVMVAVAELDLELHAPEERRRRMEDEPSTRPARARPRAARARPHRSRPRRRARRRAGAPRGTPAAGGRRRCRGRGWRARRSRRESSRLDTMVTRDLRLVGPRRAHRRARRPHRRRRAGRRDAGRRRRAPRRDRRLRRARARRSPDRQVGLLARLQRADVVAAQDGRPAARAEPERLAGRHRRRAAAPARDEQRLLHLEEEIAALVRRGPVDAEADADAGVDAARTGATPAPRRRFDVGQWATPDPGRAKRATSCARRGGRSGRTRRRGTASRAARGTRPACSRRARGSTPPPRASRRGACAAAGASRLASVADSSISRPVTENGEQGATAICTRAPGPSSCSAPASRSVSASTVSISSTSSSGGSPPSDTPRSIDPREATMRTPSSRAACTSASISPSRPRGKT